MSAAEGLAKKTGSALCGMYHWKGGGWLRAGEQRASEGVKRRLACTCTGARALTLPLTGRAVARPPRKAGRSRPSWYLEWRSVTARARCSMTPRDACALTGFGERLQAKAQRHRTFGISTIRPKPEADQELSRSGLAHLAPPHLQSWQRCRVAAERTPRGRNEGSLCDERRAHFSAD